MAVVAVVIRAVVASFSVSYDQISIVIVLRESVPGVRACRSPTVTTDIGELTAAGSLHGHSRARLISPFRGLLVKFLLLTLVRREPVKCEIWSFDILNRLSMTDECDGRTDRHSADSKCSCCTSLLTSSLQSSQVLCGRGGCLLFRNKLLFM